MRFLALPLVVLTAVIFGASCDSPTTPTAPLTIAISDVRYEHVVPFSIEPGMRVELEFWDCTLFGLPPGLTGPITCTLTRESDNRFRCANRDFSLRVSTACDSRIDVMFRTAGGNPLLQTAHDIYLTGTKVSRVTTDLSGAYPRESGSFRVDASGRVH